MAKDLQNEANITDVAEIVHHGEKLILPDEMSIGGAIKLLERRMKYENEVTQFHEDFDVMPWDGANAINTVLVQKYGWANGIPTPGFWGSEPPSMVSIEVAPGVHKQVPWGRLSLPTLEGGGYIETGVHQKHGRFGFRLSATIKRVNERQIRDLFTAVRTFLKSNSIYAGQAIKIRFLADNGKPLPMPEPEFMDTSRISRNGLIYSEDVQNAIDTNLFTPIERVPDCMANGITIKRGVLLGGTYGTGKTLAATVAARLAVDAGITYVYVPRADELKMAIEFAKQYQSPACVVFCEDIDRVMSGERSIQMDDILNILDGIDTKSSHIITVLTTNDLDAINPAMLRPGRLDAVIDVTPPDGKAVEKLIRLYGGDAVAADTNLTEAGTILAGNIPAVIAEVVKRAKLSQLRLQPAGEKVSQISEAAFIEAARTMNAQVNLLAERSKKASPPPTLDAVFNSAVQAAVSNVVNSGDFANKVGEIVSEHS